MICKGSIKLLWREQIEIEKEACGQITQARSCQMKAIGHRVRANKSRQFFTQRRDFTGMLVGYTQVYDVYTRSLCGLKGRLDKY